jgi:uncharacterized repeat protein (TIGR02543 family)
MRHNRLIGLLIAFVVIISIILPYLPVYAGGSTPKGNLSDGRYYDPALTTNYIQSDYIKTRATGYYIVKNGKVFYEYSSIVDGTPSFANGFAINCSWHSNGNGKLISGNNLFYTVVDNTSISMSRGLETLSWNSVLTVGGVRYNSIGMPKILAVDPINSNYQNNTIEWNYGICVRRLRAAEGMFQETWIFSRNPNGIVQIQENKIASMGFVWSITPFAYDATGKSIPITSDKIVKATDFNTAVYPVTIDPTTEDYISGVADGYATNSSAVYNTAWTSAIGTVTNTSPYMLIGQRNLILYYIYRGDVYFNTSALPDMAIISSANVSLYGLAKYVPGGNFSITIQSGMPDNPHIPLIIGDYNKSLYAGDGGSLNTSNFIVSGYNNISMNAAGISWINATSWTKFCLRSNKDIAGTAPGLNSGKYEYCNVSTQEAGGGKQPYLEVIYTLPPQYTLDTTSTTGGNVSIPGEGSFNYWENTIVNITATADDLCSYFINWSGDTATIADVNASSTTINMSVNASIAANFAYNTSTVIEVFNSTPIVGNWTVPIGVTSVEVLVVGGGGGGGNAGGGGGGGFPYNTSYPVVAGANVTVTIGLGGTGSPADTVNPATNGTTTIFDTIVAAGGGGGGDIGSIPICNGLDGGSGGGAGIDWDTGLAGLIGLGNIPPIIPPQGFDGGNPEVTVSCGGGGGGGASEVGYDATTTVGGNGGNGSSSTISGLLTSYSAGGGGGWCGIGGLGGGGNGECGGWIGGSPGMSNTGSGGGGGWGTPGGNGGSGIVIVSYIVPIRYSLTVIPSPTTGGHPYFNGSSPFLCGVVVDIFANISTGYLFAGWTPTDGITDPTLENTSVVMYQNRNLIAHFTKGILYPPTNLIATTNGTSCLSMTWTMGANSSNTIMVACRDTTQDCSDTDWGNLSDGCWVLYNGSNSFFTDSCGLDIDLFEYHITTWGADEFFNTSATCSNITVGGGQMIEAMYWWLGIGFAVIFFIISFWQRQWWLFIATGIIWFILMAFTFNQYTTADMMYWFGYVFLIMAIICIGCVFWFREKHEPIIEAPEETQSEKRDKRSLKLSSLKGLSDKIKGKNY